MEFAALTARALEIRQRFAAAEKNRSGRVWTREEIMQGFVVDVGDLMKLVMAKAGARPVADVDRKLAHELSDCLWSVLVLAKLYDVDLETEFQATLAALEKKLAPAPPKKRGAARSRPARLTPASRPSPAAARARRGA